jgi:hypothetical protein
MRLGEILVDHSVLSKSQLTSALTLAKERGRLLGDLLVDMGLATPEQIQIALDEQRQMEIR